MILTLSEKISALRKQSGLSQEDLAAMMNITRQAVSRWEQGESVPDIDNLVQLSTIFKVSTDYLLKDGASATSAATQIQVQDNRDNRLPRKDKPPMPWIYKKFFANYFVYIIAIGMYVVLGYAFDWWRFAWPVIAILLVIHWALEAWYEIEDDDE